MRKRGAAEWIARPEIRRVLDAFSSPETPGQVEKRLGLRKLKIKPYLERGLIESLNPKARKGRFYILTRRARRLLRLAAGKDERNKDWHLLGWVLVSPRQRIVALMFVDSLKRTSEEIRKRAGQTNPHMSRTSMKAILKELVEKKLVKTEMLERKRYYWISKKGMSIKEHIGIEYSFL